MNDEKTIKSWLNENDLILTESQTTDLRKYIGLIRESSIKMNLVSKNDLPNIIERHLLDSLHALTAYRFPEGAIVADLGSGAGFPGIPIAIARPDLHIDLIESRKLKSLFLKKVVETLDLPHVNVIHDRWENLNTLYDIVLARAVYKKEDLVKKVIPRLRPEGVLLHFVKYNSINI